MKCLVCSTELKNGAKKCSNCGFIVTKHSEEELKTSQMFSDVKEIDEEKSDTIALLENQIKTIKNILAEENEVSKIKVKKKEVSKNTIKTTSNKKDIDKTKDELVNDIERITKELENVNKDIEDNKEFIELIRSEEEKTKKENAMKHKEEKSLEEKILATAPIDKIADIITDEIVEEIAEGIDLSKNDKKNIKIKLQSNKNDGESDLDKTKEFEFDLGKTIAISDFGDTKELDRFSLIDDINNQIEVANREAEMQNEVVNDEQNAEVIDDEIIAYKDDDIIETRKKVLVFTGIAVLVLVFTLFAIWFFTKPSFNNKEAIIDPLNQYTEAMREYYKTEDIDTILYILEDIKNDKDLVRKLQAKTRNICNSWVLLYLNEEVENKEKFEDTTDKYKELLNGLYRYAIVKNDSGLVRALTEKDYNDLSIQFDNIYSDSVIFYDALEFYNQNDYNKAYYMFSRVESTNSYYDKSVSYSNKIISNIVETLTNDIKKLETNIEKYDNARKLEIYSNIEQIIIDYNSLYSNIDLTKTEEYQVLLSKYTSKVSEYTEKVLNEFSSQGSVT